MKTMKKLIINILILGTFCIVIPMSSCTKLKDKSYTDIIAKDFVPTNEDVGALVGSAYGSWRNVFGGERTFWAAQEYTSDEFCIPRKPYGWYDGGIHQRLHLHDWTSEDECWGAVWTYAYEGVTNCNRLLFQIESGQIPLEEGEEHDATVGEIRVLRASFYYILCDAFGNVPIITKYDVPEGYLPEQNTRLEVYNFIVKEITESLPALSEDHSIDTYGRFNNKWSTLALLAKIYLNAEVYTAPKTEAGEPATPGTPKWQECLDICDQIINSNKGFELEPVQRNCFKEQNQNSNELIWTVPFDEIFGPYQPLNVIALPQQSSQTFNLRSTGWGGLTSIPQFISTFDTTDKRVTDGWIRGQIYSSTGEALTVSSGTLTGEPMIVVNFIPGIDSSEEIHSFRPMKYEVPMGSDPINMSNDSPIVRYADILMMKAECLMRLGLSGAGELVTQVRMRNFVNDPSKAVVTDEQLLGNSSYDYGLRDITHGQYRGTTHETDPIMYGRFLDELGWEFCGEGHRRQDMIRFGIFNRKSYLSFKAHPAGDWDYRNIGPIPLNVLNTNPNITQNPGY
jgi:starch-binding outer membrane protein, SusD/RagB family